MSISSFFKNLLNCVVTFLTVPPVHEDPYVNAILNTKVSKEEVLNTCYLLFVDPLVRRSRERQMKAGRYRKRFHQHHFLYESHRCIRRF